MRNLNSIGLSALICILAFPAHAGKESDRTHWSGSGWNGEAGRRDTGKPKPEKPRKPSVYDNLNYMGFINAQGQFDEGWFAGGGVTGQPLSLVGRPDQPAGIQPCHCYDPSIPLP